MDFRRNFCHTTVAFSLASFLPIAVTKEFCQQRNPKHMFLLSSSRSPSRTPGRALSDLLAQLPSSPRASRHRHEIFWAVWNFIFFSQCPCVFTGGIINTPFWVYIIIIVVGSGLHRLGSGLHRLLPSLEESTGAFVRFGCSQKLLSHHSGVVTGESSRFFCRSAIRVATAHTRVATSTRIFQPQAVRHHH